MSAQSLDLDLSTEAYKSNDDSVGISDVDSKLTLIKNPPIDNDCSGSEYEVRTQPRESNIYDDAADKSNPTTVPPSSSKPSTKVLSPRKVKKSRSIMPKMTDTPEPTKNPIPSSISTPPPPSKRAVKVTNVYHLANLAYDISTVMGPRDTAENDNLLTLSNLKRENQICRKRQERKLRRLEMTREKERIDFQDKLYLAKVHNVEDTSRRDLKERLLPPYLFNGNRALTTFIDNLRTEKMVRSGWERLMNIKSKSGNCQLFERFTSITEIEMMTEKKSRTSDKYNSAKNLYILMLRLIGLNVKRDMNAHRELIGCDGPTFLWFVFKYYHTTAVQIVRTTLTKMNSLQRIMNERC